MKPFELDDTFLLSKILDDLDIDVDLNKLMKSAQKEQDLEKAGADFIYLLFKKIHKGRNSIPEFVASMLEIEIEQAKKLSLKEIKEFFLDLLKQEGIQDFFKSASEELK